MHCLNIKLMNIRALFTTPLRSNFDTGASFLYLIELGPNSEIIGNVRIFEKILDHRVEDQKCSLHYVFQKHPEKSGSKSTLENQNFGIFLSYRTFNITYSHPDSWKNISAF